MAIGEYMDTKWAGYYDVAHPDPEEPDPYHVAPPLGEAVAALERRAAHLERRVAHLERLVHKLDNRPCTDDYGNEVDA